MLCFARSARHFALKVWFLKCTESVSPTGQTRFEWRIPNGEENVEEGQEAFRRQDSASARHQVTILSSIVLRGCPTPGRPFFFAVGPLGPPASRNLSSLTSRRACLPHAQFPRTTLPPSSNRFGWPGSRAHGLREPGVGSPREGETTQMQGDSSPRAIFSPVMQDSPLPKSFALRAALRISAPKFGF